MTHRCHLQQNPYSDARRAVCSCGWHGQWFVRGRRAVEDGLEHQTREAQAPAQS